MKYKKFIEVKIDDLQLDPINPRLPRKVQGRNEKDIIEWMLRDASLLDLIGSLARHDFYPVSRCL